MIFLFPNLWEKWPKYPCQILFSRKTASFLIPVALEAPTFPPLSYIPAVRPAAEVSAGICARPEPRWGLAASPLTHGANLCLQTQAQRDREWGELSSRAGGEFPLAWRRLLGGIQAAYHLHVSIPGWYRIVAASEITEVARVTRSLSKAKQYQVVVLCQNALGTDFIEPSCLLSQYKRWRGGWPQGQAPGWRFTPAERQQLQPVCRQKGLPDHSKALWTTTACSQKNIC